MAVSYIAEVLKVCWADTVSVSCTRCNGNELSSTYDNELCGRYSDYQTKKLDTPDEKKIGGEGTKKRKEKKRKEKKRKEKKRKKERTERRNEQKRKEQNITPKVLKVK